MFTIPHSPHIRELRTTDGRVYDVVYCPIHDLPPTPRRKRFATKEEALAFAEQVERDNRYRAFLDDAVPRLQSYLNLVPKPQRKDAQELLSDIYGVALAGHEAYICKPRRVPRVTKSRARIGFTVKQRIRLIEHFGRVCQYCGQGSDTVASGPDGMSWEIDHIRPVAAGGRHAPENWTLACYTCNQSKKDNPLPDRIRPRSARGFVL